MLEQLQSLPKSKIFLQIDLNSGYYLIPLDPRDYKYTSFVLPFGQFEFTKLPFGLANAPRIFQRTMNNMLGKLDFVKVFLDDILIFSNSIIEHRRHLEQVFGILRNNQVSINFDNNNFLKEEVTYLGNIIDKDEIGRSQET